MEVRLTFVGGFPVILIRVHVIEGPVRQSEVQWGDVSNERATIRGRDVIVVDVID